MTPEQATALIVAATGLIGAVGVLIVQVRSLRKDVNGRLTHMLSLAADAGRKEGELAGRDFANKSAVDRPAAISAPAIHLTANE